MRTLATPPSRPVVQPAIERQQAELRALFPRAACWYGARSGLWPAAPAGATALVQAPTAAELARELAEHYRRHPEGPRPARPLPPGRPGGPGAVVRTSPQPVASRTTAPSGTPHPPRRGRHTARAAARDRHGMWRRGLTHLGLIAVGG